MKTTLLEISEKSGFSLATVSNAINHKKGVNKKTADKIITIAHELGYFNSQKIQSIRLILIKNNGKIISDTPFFSQLYQGIELECQRFSYETLVSTLYKDKEDYKQLLDPLINDPTCGVIILSTELEPNDFALFENSTSPLLLLDNWPENMKFNALLIANTDSACQAVEYLIEKGHKEIGYLKSNVRIKNFFYRQEGFYRALLLHNLAAKEEYEILLPPNIGDSWQAMELYLDSNPLLPTAFFADNDNIALGALKAFESRGIRVPEDISIIGFDDLPFSEFSTPPLTTIRVPKVEMGQLAVRTLLDNIDANLSTTLKTQICTSLIERNSVKKI